jgi:microcystin degradation protein MlrC
LQRRLLAGHEENDDFFSPSRKLKSLNTKTRLHTFRFLGLRIATGTISHETNTFCAYPTTLDNFKHDRHAPRSVKTGYLSGKDFFDEFSGTKSVAGGFIDASKSLGFELVPTIWANATPGGVVSGEPSTICYQHFSSH